MSLHGKFQNFMKFSDNDCAKRGNKNSLQNRLLFLNNIIAIGRRIFTKMKVKKL